MSIHLPFKRRFDEMEGAHLQLYKRFNAFSELGSDLETRLHEEVIEWSGWVYSEMDSIGAIAEGFDTKSILKHREFVKNSKYHKVIQEASFCRQIINKPEGYAGDAEMMRIIYHNGFEGSTPFGKFMNKLAVQTEACQAVRNRRTFLREQIMQVKNSGGGGNVLSIAAGPAMEIQDVLANDPSGDTFHFHAFDHDMKTIREISRQCREPRFSYVLGNAFHLIKGSYAVAVPRKPLMDYCDPRKDFKGIRKAFAPVKYTRMKLRKEAYALVYSAGLYDYIKTFPDDPAKGTIALTKNLFELVQPGGSLVIGNFSPNNPPDVRFIMDYVCDWKLIHRTREAMLDFARAIPEHQIGRMEVLQEPLGINYFLKIEKRMNA